MVGWGEGFDPAGAGAGGAGISCRWDGFSHLQKAPMAQSRGMLKSFPLHFLFSHQQGTILEKLGICSMPQFVSFMYDLLPVKQDPDVVVKDLRFGTIPVKVYQPKVSSCTPRRGVLYFHGGGAIIGSLSKSPSLSPGPWCDSLRAGWMQSLLSFSRHLKAAIMTREHQGP